MASHCCLTSNAFCFVSPHPLPQIFAEYAKFEKARTAFESVREAATDIRSVWLNLGHCHLALQQYKEAIQVNEPPQHHHCMRLALTLPGRRCTAKC